MAVLRGDVGSVVKQVEVVSQTELPTLSTNPIYRPCTCLADDAQIVGKVLRTIGRM